MEELQNTQTAPTQTATETKPAEKSFYIIYPAVFVKFAEYLGYVSKLLPWCDSWVAGKEPEEFKKKAIAVDAQNIFKQMLKDMSETAIREYYEAFYEVIIYEWDDAIDKLEFKPSQT